MNASLPSPVSRRRFHAYWLVPIAFLTVVTVLFRIFPWDIQWASRGYDIAHKGFLYAEEPWVRLLYRFAGWPGIALAVAALAGLIGSVFHRPLRAARRYCWVIFLSLALGPGLIVNTLLKDHWGRPRPVQVAEFGGGETFLMVGTLGTSPEGRSFSSGHASIAFYLVTPFFALIAIRPRLAWTFLAAGIAWGLVVGTGRVLQGGHWPSDVLWSGGLVSLTAFVLSRAFGLLRPPGARTSRLP